MIGSMLFQFLGIWCSHWSGCRHFTQVLTRGQLRMPGLWAPRRGRPQRVRMTMRAVAQLRPLLLSYFEVCEHASPVDDDPHNCYDIRLWQPFDPAARHSPWWQSCSALGSSKRPVPDQLGVLPNRQQRLGCHCFVSAENILVSVAVRHLQD